MAIALTEQPTNDGYYSGYLPVIFIATETANNPAYLTFELRTSAGATIANVPPYKASNIDNEFTFDASNYLKSVFDVRGDQGLSTATIEDLTDSYGKFEIVISSTTIGVADLTSNEFYAFANIDGLRYLNDQTANDGISRKALLYGSELQTNKTFGFKIQGEYDHVVMFTGLTPFLSIETYEESRPNNGSAIKQNRLISLTSYNNKLISVPLNRAFLDANAPPIGGGLILRYEGFRVRDATTDNKMYYYFDDYCNDKEFVFINKYGVKENIKFRSYLNENFQTKGETFRVGGFDHVAQDTFFNTSADNQKINQISTEEFEVKGQRFLKTDKEMLKDFISSPFAGVVENSEIKAIYLTDGSFKLVETSRGVDFSFKYQYAQTKLSFK